MHIFLWRKCDDNKIAVFQKILPIYQTTWLHIAENHFIILTFVRTSNIMCGDIFKNYILHIEVCFLFSFRKLGMCGIHMVIPLSSLPYVGEERQAEVSSWRDML
jgi:hypothetical protein